MKKYIGVKRINAKPMNRLDYVNYRNWELPDDEDGTDEGYLVEYLDGGKANHENHSNYISWSPKDVFENAYHETSGLSFGMAIEAAKLGMKVARSGWNGKDMWIAYMTPMHLPAYSTQGNVRKVNDRTANLIGEDMPLDTLGYFAMWTADKKWLPGWLASQTDILAEDWRVVE